MFNIQKNETKSICSLCKGECCKDCSGIMFPQDLGEITVDLLIRMFEEGYQFDYWEGNPMKDKRRGRGKTFYYIRPQHTNSKNIIINPTYQGVCIFLTEKGCSKKFKERPTQCRALVASKFEDKGCTYSEKFSKRNASISWLPYNVIILKAIKKLEEKYPQYQSYGRKTC